MSVSATYADDPIVHGCAPSQAGSFARDHRGEHRVTGALGRLRNVCRRSGEDPSAAVAGPEGRDDTLGIEPESRPIDDAASLRVGDGEDPDNVALEGWDEYERAREGDLDESDGGRFAETFGGDESGWIEVPIGVPLGENQRRLGVVAGTGEHEFEVAVADESSRRARTEVIRDRAGITLGGPEYSFDLSEDDLFTLTELDE